MHGLIGDFEPPQGPLDKPVLWNTDVPALPRPVDGHAVYPPVPDDVRDVATKLVFRWDHHPFVIETGLKETVQRYQHQQDIAAVSHVLMHGRSRVPEPSSEQERPFEGLAGGATGDTVRGLAAPRTVVGSSAAETSTSGGSRDDVAVILARRRELRVPDGHEEVMGPDPFGVRRRPAGPGFLAGYNFGDLHASKRAAFFDRMDMVSQREVYAAGLRPAALEEGPVSSGRIVPRNNGEFQGLAKVQKVPHLVHSIWFGGPLYDDGGSRALFMRNVADGKAAARGFTFVVWTDVPRMEIAAALHGSAPAGSRARQVGEMVNWAKKNNIRLVNVDEVFSAGHPMTVVDGQVRTERARGNPVGWAAASDLARVEILHRFGGVYSDGDNDLARLGGLAKAAKAAANSRPGYAVIRLTSKLSNAVMSSAAGSRGASTDLEVLRAHYRQPFSTLRLTSNGGQEALAHVSDADHDALNRAIDTRSAAREIIVRTGPGRGRWEALAGALGYGPPGSAFDQLPEIPADAIGIGSSNSWGPAQPGRSSASQQPALGQASPHVIADAVVGAVTSLHRDMLARPRTVYLPAAARTIDRLPESERPAAWDMTIRHFVDTLPPSARVTQIAGDLASLPDDARGRLADHFPDLMPPRDHASSLADSTVPADNPPTATHISDDNMDAATSLARELGGQRGGNGQPYGGLAGGALSGTAAAHRSEGQTSSSKADKNRRVPERPDELTTLLNPERDVDTNRQNEPQPAVPWYARGRDGFHALGDAEVTKVTRTRDAAADAAEAVQSLKDAIEAARNEDLRVSSGLSKKLTRGIVKALESSDPVEWEKRLGTGLVEGDGDTVVRAWFSLVPRAAGTGDASLHPGGTGAAAKNSVLSPYRSKYGDVSSQKTVNKTQSSNIGMGNEVLLGGAGAATLFGPALDIGFSASRTDGRTFADEVQAGSRPIVNGKAEGAYTVRVDLLAMSRRTPDGVQAHHDVGDMVVTATHPEPLTKDDLAATRPAIDVLNPAAVEEFKTTFGAIDSRPLEKAFLAALLKSKVVGAAKAAGIAVDAVREAIGEKPLRDRARYLPGGLPGNFTTTKRTIPLRGFNGYVSMKSVTVRVQPIGDVKGDNRDDIAETVTIVAGTGHGSSFDLKAGVVVGLPHSVTVTGHPVSVGTESSHTTRSSVQGQPKTAIVDSGGNLRRYKTVVQINAEIHADRNTSYDFREGTFERSKPVVEFSANLDSELLVPAHYADNFEAKIQEDPGATATEDDRYGAPPGLDGAKSQQLAQTFGAHKPPVGQLAGRVAGKPGPRRERETGPALFPAHGLRTNAELINYLRQTATTDDPVALRIPSRKLDPSGTAVPDRFTAGQLGELAKLQEDGKLRLFEVTAAGGTHTLTGNPAPATQ